ncbi:hypothetical protein IWQ62_003802 [Dispira parvispora]|uniref:Uncharacterized protein n=1 Tax=Dispira parvispora TaxID=1520584 RepID=A0A9W8E677_9FUNG|nr:hypothetical protein IWQ62_003802 [Dispira parvispora]
MPEENSQSVTTRKLVGLGLTLERVRVTRMMYFLYPDSHKDPVDIFEQWVRDKGIRNYLIITPSDFPDRIGLVLTLFPVELYQRQQTRSVWSMEKEFADQYVVLLEDYYFYEYLGRDSKRWFYTMAFAEEDLYHSRVFNTSRYPAEPYPPTDSWTMH